jgi:hypothetical protein
MVSVNQYNIAVLWRGDRESRRAATPRNFPEEIARTWRWDDPLTGDCHGAGRSRWTAALRSTGAKPTDFAPPNRRGSAKTGLVGTRRRDTGSFLRLNGPHLPRVRNRWSNSTVPPADRDARRRQLATCHALHAISHHSDRPPS